MSARGLGGECVFRRQDEDSHLLNLGEKALQVCGGNHDNVVEHLRRWRKPLLRQIALVAHPCCPVTWLSELKNLAKRCVARMRVDIVAAAEDLYVRVAKLGSKTLCPLELR